MGKLTGATRTVTGSRPRTTGHRSAARVRTFHYERGKETVVPPPPKAGVRTCKEKFR